MARKRSRPSQSPTRQRRRTTRQPSPTAQQRRTATSSAVESPLQGSPRNFLAAWDVGRLFNRLTFHLERAWFRSGEDWIVAGQISDQLSLSVRELGVNPRQQDGLRDAIVAERRDWEAMIGSEEYAESYGDQNNWLRNSEQSSLSEQQLLDAACRRFLSPVTAVGRCLQETIEGALDETQTRIFRLATFFDQALRPPFHVDDQMLALANDRGAQPTSESTTLDPSREIRSIADAFNTCEQPTPAPLALPRIVASPAPAYPLRHWFAEIACRWEELSTNIRLPLPPAETITNLGTPNEVIEIVGRVIWTAISEWSGRDRGGWDEATFSRNQWIYECLVANTHYKKVIAAMGSEHPQWEQINSAAGLKRAAGEYARRFGLEPLRPRKPGRPPQSEK
jgi:hypothetical protein